MNTVINIRTQKATHERAKRVFAKLGISTSAGINMFLRQVSIEGGLPFIPTTRAERIGSAWDKAVAKALKTQGYTKGAEALKDL